VQERIDVARDLLGEKQCNELVDVCNKQSQFAFRAVDRRAQNNYKRLFLVEGESRLVM
jgi:hypothetical protein